MADGTWPVLAGGEHSVPGARVARPAPADDRPDRGARRPRRPGCGRQGGRARCRRGREGRPARQAGGREDRGGRNPRRGPLAPVRGGDPPPRRRQRAAGEPGRARGRRGRRRLTPALGDSRDERRARPTAEGPGPRLSYTRAMSVLPILTLGDPRLRLRGQPVETFNKFLHGLIDDLTATMRHAPGVGLAAPQLGEALNVAVVEVEDRLFELVNPRLVREDGENRDLEGCLSIPGYVAYVTRKEKVWVVAQNRVGRKYKVAGSGFLGRAFQHELDHLQGKLYVDYLASPDELIPLGRSSSAPGRSRSRSSMRSPPRQRLRSSPS